MGTGLQFQRFSSLSPWWEAWRQAGRDRRWQFYIQVFRQQGHTHSNKATPPYPSQEEPLPNDHVFNYMSLWGRGGVFLSKPPHRSLLSLAKVGTSGLLQSIIIQNQPIGCQGSRKVGGDATFQLSSSQHSRSVHPSGEREAHTDAYQGSCGGLGRVLALVLRA